MEVVRNTPRVIRSILSVKAMTGVLAVYALSPALTGRSLWHFGVIHEGKYHVIGKGVSSRDVARVECHRRYNQPIKENHLRKRKAA